MLRAKSDAPSDGTSAPRSHRRALRVGWLASGATALALLLSPVLHRPQLRLVWNASASVPLGLYQIARADRLHVGDMVAVRPSQALARFMAERRYVEANALLVKPVAAVAGATVCREQLRVTVSGRVAATALARDRVGRPLPRWSGCLRLGPDQLFLIAPQSPASFDGRYFGIVRNGQVIGRVTPLWTWK